ncbi:recombinase RecT [Methylobacterium oryzisoli]|uniref:recombinase RecT n=1 Tax=Methylobacterium oryzisoli TaxID=3385502 RepID=UPI0038918BC0
MTRRRSVRVDYLKPHAIVDLKSTRPTRPTSFKANCLRAVAEYDYPVQAAAYLQGRSQLARLVADGRVHGDHDPAWLARVATAPAYAFVFVFWSTGDAPLTWGFALSPGNDVLTIAEKTVDAALWNYVVVLGDEERIEHEPKLDGPRGAPRATYAIAKTKDGGIYREVMSLEEIEKVRRVSRAANKGPWVDWWEEMARKTVLRRLAKRLPMSTDMDDLIRRDDELYDFGRRGGGDRPFKAVANPLADQIEHQPPVDAPEAEGAGDDLDTAEYRGSEGDVTDSGDFPGDEALRAMEREPGRGRRGASREG